MKPARFDYVRPATLPDALDVLARHGGDAAVLAGGQSLMPMMNLRLATPAVLVDIGRIPELDPLVVDRFRMWGVNGLAVMGWALTGYFYGLSTGSIGIAAVFGLIAAAGLWLAFLPPTWYRRRLLGKSLQGA